MSHAREDFSFENFCMVLDAAQDGIFIYDKNLVMLYANSSAVALCGLEGVASVGSEWHNLKQAGYFKGDAAPNAAHYKKRFSSEFVNDIGRHLLCTATPVLDAQGELRFVVSNVRDVTNLIELRAELDDRNRQLSKVRKTLDILQGRQHNNFVYASGRMNNILETIERVAHTDVSVFLLGESGVGKTRLAERIHKLSARSSGNLMVVNCGAIPSTLCEAEFFGYEKGAFTGADRATPGLFESATGGTLVLDEIGELDLAMQVKLLRVLQERRVKRLGSQREIPVDFRIVAATNRDIKEMVATRKFREDLYHRLNVVQIYIPPLRERPEDIKCLLSHFLSFYNAKYGMDKTMLPQLVATLERYSWPGNSREMAHLIERLVVISATDELDCEYLPEEIRKGRGTSNLCLEPLREAAEAAERTLLQAARDQLGNTRNMARVLQVSHVTVARKMRRYGIA